MSTSEGRPDFRRVKSADRTLDVLETLARHGRVRPSLASLSEQLGIPKSSLHSILRTMESRGWVEADGGLTYTLGLRALIVGASFVEGDVDVLAAKPGVDWLAAQTGETVHLGRLDQFDVVYLAKRDSTHSLRLSSSVGWRLPAHATAMGKALLAQLPEENVDHLLPDVLPALTPRTITSPVELREELDGVRRRGYAIDREENTTGIRCLAAAIPGRSPAHDAISVSVPVARMTGARMKDLIPMVQEAARVAAQLRR